MARKLRIAVSVFFAVVAVALCVLWVRSFSTSCQITAHGVGSYATSAQDGKLIIFRSTSPLGFMQRDDRIIYSDSHTLKIILPIWIVIFATSTASGLPWARPRFSLRTLLIATTLMAGVLGLGVWLAA
jgi:hypothetical protein